MCILVKFFINSQLITCYSASLYELFTHFLLCPDFPEIFKIVPEKNLRKISPVWRTISSKTMKQLLWHGTCTFVVVLFCWACVQLQTSLWLPSSEFSYQFEPITHRLLLDYGKNGATFYSCWPNRKQIFNTSDFQKIL